MKGYETEYLTQLKEKFLQAYEVARRARSKGFDPLPTPEPIPTVDLAERVEKSVGPPGVASRIRELTSSMSREEAAFKIAEEITLGKFGDKGVAAAEQAIRTALSILDEGVTVAPIQGIVKVEEGVNPDGTKHLSIYFAGPIRSAGGTEMALTLVVADFSRRLLGLDRYKATEAEAKRFLEELRLYERAVARFQYKFPDQVILNAIMRLPVDANGVETDPVEVSSFRNLKRVKTNRVRGGALRVVNDGLLGRANKVLRIVGKLGIDGWEWLEEVRALKNDPKGEHEPLFMEEVIAGRPIFSLPSAFYGFRLRYGRSRSTGLASVGVHPATMKVLKDFVATGTQLRLEKPGKAGIVVPVETIEGPVVKLIDGSVVKVETQELAEKVAGKVEEILFLGDVLVGFGEFVENNVSLSPPGFVEEWWREYLRLSLSLNGFPNEGELGIAKARLLSFLNEPLKVKPTPQEALTLSKRLGIPLHPAYVYFWENISVNELERLRAALSSARKEFNGENVVKLSFPRDENVKKILEKLCVPHTMVDGAMVVDEAAPILWACLNPNAKVEEKGVSARECVEKISGLKILPKGGSFIGARMGRPEKAKRREMRPLVHCLFPLALSGGPQRNLMEAAERNGAISVEVANRKCPSCGETVISPTCPKCGSRSIVERSCPTCGRALNSNQGFCPACKRPPVAYRKLSINVKEMVKAACDRLGVSPPRLVKCVKGLSSEGKVPEPIEKGILRAKHGLSVFKDGTVRFDATNAPLSHFKPSEVRAPVEKLRSLGYIYDKDGEPLARADQLCPLKIQDIVIPRKCGEYFVKVAGFIDELLQKFYGLPPYYNVESIEDLIGHLVVGLSPHTSVGVIGRIVGFTEANVCFAHPIWHAAKRRDCDGDEDSVALLMDVLLNFSRSFLPEKIGGMMDAPLLLNLIVNPQEVARQAFNIETVESFPLAFYEAASRGEDPKVVSDLIELYLHRLNGEEKFEQLHFTHPSSDINAGNHESSYTKLKSMLDKLAEQLDLAEKIRAVEAGEVAKKVVSTHFLRDLTGNLRAFSSQQFRCKKCNAKYRRVPLSGRCLKCGGELSLTVFQGTIEKYLEITKKLVDKYALGEYYKQRLSLIDKEIETFFRGFKRKEQKALSEFM